MSRFPRPWKATPNFFAVWLRRDQNDVVVQVHAEQPGFWQRRNIELVLDSAHARAMALALIKHADEAEARTS